MVYAYGKLNGILQLEPMKWGFPGGAVVKNPPAIEPWSGKIPHAAEQLGPWATTAEPARLEPVLRNKRGRGSERPRAPR